MSQSSFFIKGVYLILILIVIAFVINQITSLHVSSTEQQKDIELIEKSNNILETLAGNNNCLAYEEPASIEGKHVELATHRVIDINKLNEFSQKYSDVEPDCAKDFTYGYRVEVETLPVNISTVESSRGESVFGELLELIDGKKTMFIIDLSGSMRQSAGKCEDYTIVNTKLCCLKKFLIGFIEEMDENSEISVLPYAYPPCERERLFDFMPIAGNQEFMEGKIVGLKAEGGTPMCVAFKNGFEYAINENAEAIVLLTDGCENCCCKRGGGGCPTGDYSSVDIANEYSYSGIPVYTVGFGVGVCKTDLDKISEKTHGEFFEAKTCEELVSKPKEQINVTIKPMKWSFGDSVFSEKDALDQKNIISLPVMVYVNQSTFLPAKMKIILVKGELEQLVGFIEASCVTEKSLSLDMKLDYPVTFEKRQDGNYICMQFNEKKCQKLGCKKEIEFSNIQRPGHYKFYSNIENGVLKIVV